MAKQITIKSVLAAINGGKALGSDICGKIEGDKILLIDENKRIWGNIAVVDARLDVSGVDQFLAAFCFGKVEEWILAAIPNIQEEGPKVDLSTMSVEELLALQTEIKAALAARDGKPLELVSDRGERFCPRPSTGYILFCEMAACRAISEDWYATLDAAKAGLLRIANRYECAPREDLMFVDLTAPGCNDSRAWIFSIAELNARTITTQGILADGER